MSAQAFLASEIMPRKAADCRFHVIPVPYEATVSYGSGTARGPAAILEASQQLEVWTGRSVPSERGIYTWPPVACSGGAEEVLDRIEAAVTTALAAGSAEAGTTPRFAAPPLPVILGGEHTVTLGALRALKKRYGHFGVVQFDAHADLRDSYEGTPYSHACVMRRAVDDLGLSLFQIGVRGLCPEEVAFRKERGILHLDARAARFPLPRRMDGPDGENGPRPAPLPADFPAMIFLSFDLDAFDASLMPATGTPEPGGLFWWDALLLAEDCLANRVVLGFDVVELAPIAGMHAPNYTAARLTHELMGIIGEKNG